MRSVNDNQIFKSGESNGFVLYRKWDVVGICISGFRVKDERTIL